MIYRINNVKKPPELRDFGEIPINHDQENRDSFIRRGWLIIELHKKHCLSEFIKIMQKNKRKTG